MRDGKEATGTIDIPEFMHDTKWNELVLDVTLDNATREKEEIKEVVRVQFAAMIRDLFKNFTADLMSAHAKDVYITNEEMKGHPVLETYKPKPPVDPLSSASTAAKTQVGSLVTITQTIEFQCSAKDLYETLVDPKRVQIWTRAPCQISPQEGSDVLLFGGNITGKITSLVSLN